MAANVLPSGDVPSACGEPRWRGPRWWQRPLRRESSCSCCPGDGPACVWAEGRFGELRSQDQGTRVSTALAVEERNGVGKGQTCLWLAGVVCDLVDVGVVGGGSVGRLRHGRWLGRRGGEGGRMRGRRKTRACRVLTRKWATGILACRTPKRGLYYISRRTSRRNHHPRILALYVIYVSLSISKRYVGLSSRPRPPAAAPGPRGRAACASTYIRGDTARRLARRQIRAQEIEGACRPGTKTSVGTCESR